MNVLKRQSTEKSVSLGQFGVQTMSQCINYMDFLLCTVINIPMCELTIQKVCSGSAHILYPEFSKLPQLILPYS